MDGGHRAVKFSRIGGVQNKIYGEGTHFVIPWFETPIIYDVRAKPRNIQSLTGTKGFQLLNLYSSLFSDLQMVNITVRVLSRPRIEALPTILQTLGTDYGIYLQPKK